MQPQFKTLPRPQKPPLYLQVAELEAQHPQTIVFIWYASGYVAYGKSANKVKDLLGGSIQFDRWAKDKKIEFYDFLRLARECEANDLGLMYLTTTGKIKHPIKAPVKIMRPITIPEPPPPMLPATIPERPKLSPAQIILLSAFMQTMVYPVFGYILNGQYIQYPCLYPTFAARMLEIAKRKLHKPSKTPDIIHLPAPASVNKSVDLLGFARDCKIIETITNYGETWVKLQKTIGKHHMVIYRKLSQIQEQ